MCVFVLDWSEEVGTICGIYVPCMKLNDQQVIGPQRPCQCWKADSCGLNSDSHQRRLSSNVTFIHSRFVVCLSMLWHSMLHSSEVVSSCLNMQRLALINSLTPSSVTNLSNTIENGSVDSLTPWGKFPMTKPRSHECMQFKLLCVSVYLVGRWFQTQDIRCLWGENYQCDHMLRQRCIHVQQQGHLMEHRCSRWAVLLSALRLKARIKLYIHLCECLSLSVLASLLKDFHCVHKIMCASLQIFAFSVFYLPPTKLRRHVHMLPSIWMNHIITQEAVPYICIIFLQCFLCF